LGYFIFLLQLLGLNSRIAAREYSLAPSE